jgi:hypothetical protein
MNNLKNTSMGFAFGRINYLLMIIGVIVIAVGFLLMIGGASEDPNYFDEEIFSFRRISLAPTVVLLGFAIQVVAIMKKSKD